MSDDEVAKWGDIKKYCAEQRDGCKLLRDEKEKSARPAQIITTASLLAGTLGVAVGVMFYVNASEIKSHMITEALTYVSKDDNERQMTRLESRIGRVEDVVGNSNAMLVDISRKLDKATRP